MKRIYNWKPDRRDPRDLLRMTPVPQTLPDKIDLRPFFSPIENQNSLGSCTSHAAVSGAFEYLQIKELKDPKTVAPVELGPKFTHGSRLFHYYNERVLRNTVNEDSGAEIRDSVKALSRWGVCPEDMWPYIEDRFTEAPSPEAYRVAANHRISQYRRLVTLPQVKATLAEGYPVIFGIMIYESFESEHAAKTGFVPKPLPYEQLLGGHAVCAAGYDNNKNALIVRNSWGTEWGDNGYFYLPYDYASDNRLAMDYWVIRR